MHNIANVGGGARTTSPGYSEPVGAESWVEGDYMSDEEGDYKEDWGEGSATTSSNVTPIPDHDLCGMYELHYINWWDYEDGYELDSGANGYTVYCS